MAQRISFLAGRSGIDFADWQKILDRYGYDMADVTSKLLDLIRVKGAAFIGKNLEQNWNMTVAEHGNLARFHLILSGSTWIELPEGRVQERLNTGDLVIVPNGREHCLKENLNAQDGTFHNIPDDSVGPVFDHFDKERDCANILCGYFQISSAAPPPLISQLPQLLVQRRKTGGSQDKIGLIVQLIEKEMSNRITRNAAVLNRLTESLFIYAIQDWIERETRPEGRLNRFSDSRLQNVLREIHENPTKAWTVDSLAKVCGLSRTAFSIYFKSVIGMSPINYIMTWRIGVARQLLEDGELTLSEIAQSTGYADVNAFNRAFKRVTGSPPGKFRRLSQK